MGEQKTKEDYRWIELAVLLPDGKMVRNHFVQMDDTKAIANLRCRYSNTDIFYSICIYAEPTCKARFVAPLYFDLDGPENLPATRESTLQLCELITDIIDVPYDCLDIFFSGNKGFHVMIPCEVFQPFYSVEMFALYKQTAEQVEKVGIQFVDKSVYSERRIWRFPNSINSKSGLYKIPLTYEEVRDIDIGGILEIAKSPRLEDSYVLPSVCPFSVSWYKTEIERLRSESTKCSYYSGIQRFRTGWRMVPCVRAIESTTLPDGTRHVTYLSLARYFGYLNMHYEEILERLTFIDSRNPIRDPDSIERAADFGCSHPGFPGCDDPAFMRYCQKDNCFYAKLKDSRNAKQT